MMRKFIKRWLYGSCPGFAGSFPYFGTRIYFPRNSVSFLAACAEGVYEADNVRLLSALIEPDSMLFDIGANIGLMAAPVLHQQPNARVVSFEPSPNTLPFLRRTIAESAYRDRWTLVPKAVGAESGKVSFSLSDQKYSLFDGIRPTHRVATVGRAEVEMTSVDTTWTELGKPAVSVLKCDVEGGELGALSGAVECLSTMRPAVLLEWNRKNLVAYDIAPNALLHFAIENGFRVLAVPSLVEVISPKALEAHMAFTESFLLLPR